MKATRKSHFIDTKVILIVVGLSLLAYLIVSVGYYLYDTNATQHKMREAENTAKAEFLAKSKNDQAIDKSTTFIEASITNILPRDRLMLDYMQRKFSLSSILSARATPFDLGENSPAYPTEINYLARIAFPDKRLSIQPKEAASETTLTNIYSASCDSLPLPKEFWPTMRANLKAGDSGVTSDAFAFILLKHNGCIVPFAQSDLYEEVQVGLVKIAQEETSPADVRYEALVYLLMLGKFDVIEESWIDKLISEQLPDGSWTQDNETNDNRNHATVMALWTLLEYREPTKPYVSVFPER